MVVAIFEGLGAPALQQATLIIPAVSVGNVGQLASDLLVNTLSGERVARLQDDALLPAVGQHPFNHVGGLTVALEAFALPGGGGGPVAALQQRSPAAPGTQTAFAERLAEFVKTCGVKEVLVLGSMESAVRRDQQLEGTQLRCFAVPASSGSDSSTAAASSSPDSAAASEALLQRCKAAAGGTPLLEDSFWADLPLEKRQLPPWPLLRALRAAGVPSAALLCFSAEGDNVGDALRMASAAAEVAALPAPGNGGTGEAAGGAGWRPPASWQHLYGSATPVY